MYYILPKQAFSISIAMAFFLSFLVIFYRFAGQGQGGTVCMGVSGKEIPSY